MRKIAFLVGVLGLGVLIGFLIGKPSNVDSLDGLNVGDVVQIKGLVEEERNFGSGRLLIVNEMPVFCECTGKYGGLEVVATGIIERFPEDLRIRAFTIETLD